MKACHLIAIATSLSFSATAFAASDAEALFKKNNCSMCHAVAGASLGPSLKDISAKYAKAEGAQTQLEAKVRNGGKGSFGEMPMPPTPKSASDEDIKVLVGWILMR
ncbi:MAG: c-type cytochrome [Gallionella sp.]